MADAPTPTLDAAAIKLLVEEVVRRIRGDGTAASPPTPASAAAGPVGRVALADAVITLAQLERLPSGTREVTVTARAVVTPSARDRAREAGIAIVRNAAGTAGGPAPVRPFVIGQADGREHAAGRAASIARAVPHAQRLPATGLADVVAALAQHASRDAARCVLLTSRPAVALVLANRAPGLRAVTARDAGGLAAAAAEAAANLLVIDPAGFTGGIERACADFAARPAGPVPAELAAAPAGCACKSHPH